MGTGYVCVCVCNGVSLLFLPYQYYVSVAVFCCPFFVNYLLYGSGTDGLPLHTDFTYVRDPPGLQVFTMRAPALVGGESVFADGLVSPPIVGV